MVRLMVWLGSVASILSKIASAMSCSALSTSSQSPARADMPWVKNFRPRLAAMAKAAPPIAALTRAPVPFEPKEKALRPFPERDPVERLRLLLLDVRDLVVGI